MKIISKFKDYYDWCQSIYGIDEKVVFDRRGTDDNPLLILEKALKEAPWTVLSSLNFNRIHTGDYWNRGSIWIGDKVWDFYIYTNQEPYHTKDLEIRWEGPEDILLKRMGREDSRMERMWGGRYRLSSRNNEIRNGKRIDRKVLIENIYRGSQQGLIPKEEAKKAPIILSIDNKLWFNPILRGTPIEKFIPAEEAWTLIQDFLSSLKDVEIVDTRTDKEKLQSAGFDSKTSFRNVK